MGVPGDPPLPLATDRPSDDALWSSVAEMLRDVVLPVLPPGWARAQAIQLVALAEHARTRGPDPARRRTDELAAALDSLADNPLVRDRWPGEPYATVAAVLAAAIDAEDDAGAQVQAVLRPLLVSHLDDELAVTTPLIEAFRGRLPQR
jgi:plasmid stabilization system protein ParE